MTPKKLRILLIDDDSNMVRTMSDIISAKGFEPITAKTGSEALAHIKQQDIDVALIDIRLEDMSGMDVLRRFNEDSPLTECILLTGYASQNSAIEAINAGAYAYFLKPFDIDQLFLTIQRAVEKQAAEKALKESEERFRVIFEQANDAIHIENEDDEILAVNESMCKLLGYSREELLKMRVADLMAPENRPSNRILQRELLEHGDSIFEGMDMHRDGRRIPVEISIGRIERPSGDLFVSILRDITERKQAEESIRRHLAELQVLYENSLAINNLQSVKEIAYKLFEIISQNLPWRQAYVHTYNDEDQRVEFVAHSRVDKIGATQRTEVERLIGLNTQPGDGLVGWVIQHGRPLRIGNVLADPIYIMGYPEIRSALHVPMKVADRVIGVISAESEMEDAFTEADERLLTTLAAQASVAVERSRLLNNLQRSNLDLIHAYDATILGWSTALELRDYETQGHSQRVTDKVIQLAQSLGIPENEMKNIRYGALLHDIGKMGVPDGILLKPGKLTDEEWVWMKKHPVFAHQLLAPIDYLQEALDIPHYHHEKWDGSGYPDGLMGEQIPLSARLFAVIDVYDALISDRPYRAAWSREKTLAYMQEQSGIHFDPEVLSVFLQLEGWKGN